MEQTGTIIACSTSPDKVRSMNLEKGQNPDPLIFLFATILKPEDINVLFEIPDNQIHQVLPDMTVRCLGSTSSGPVPAEATPEPVVAVNSNPMPAKEPEPAAAVAPVDVPARAQQKTLPRKQKRKPACVSTSACWTS
jgi:two-component system chemotaxis sensor kinase CheA